MSKGDWGRYGAIALGILLYAFMFFDMGASYSEHRTRADSYAEQAQANRAENVARACRGVEPSRSVDCVADQRDVERGEQRTEQDLGAQRGMAEAAWWMVFVSALTLLATAVGIWFVKKTLETNLGFLEESQGATKAMVRQNQLSEQGQRPWLKLEIQFEQVEFFSGHVSWAAVITATNIGTGPALGVAVSAVSGFDGFQGQHNLQSVLDFSAATTQADPVFSEILLPGQPLARQFSVIDTEPNVAGDDVRFNVIYGATYHSPISEGVYHTVSSALVLGLKPEGGESHHFPITQLRIHQLGSNVR